MLKSWTTCVRCWSRRNSPAVTRWSSEERRKSICPFPACPRRESISSLPALCSTPICIRLWSDTLVWLCGSMSGTKTSRMKPAPCPAPLPCSLWDWRDEQWCAAGGGVSGSLRRRALLPAREIPSCLYPEVWFPTMDTAGIGPRGALSMQNLKPAKEFRSLIANAESLDALLDSQAPLFRLSPAGRGQGPEIPGLSLGESLLWAIWGPASENGGSKVIKTAPKELKEKYQQVFA